MSSTSEKRGRGRPKTLDRERTLATAMECYWSEGPYGMSINEICRRAGVSKPGLYREFGGEDQLMVAVLTRYDETVMASMLALIAEDRPFKDALHALVDMITVEAAASSAPVGCLLAKMRAAPSRLGPLTRAYVNKMKNAFVTAYTDWLERAKAHGEINTSLPTNVGAAYLDTQLTTILMQMSAGEDMTMIRAQANLAFFVLTGEGFDTK